MANTVFVISKHGERLMPTKCLGKVRHMLKDGRAVILKHQPFTIQLTYETSCYIQDVELCVDTGYQHIGISVKSESQEYVAQQYDLLNDEKKRHDECRKYRRTRRNRLRYRKPRFSNRKRQKGWLAPSLNNKADRHIDIVKKFCAVAPVTKVILEVGQFDTQVLAAIQEGKPVPEGEDYQHGERYGIDTLREAVFQRDEYKCRICERSGIKDNAILHVHHVYFWRGQHGNRLSELMTVCEKCHTPANHKPGGKLYGYNEQLPEYNGAAFMNTVRWYIYNQVKGSIGNLCKVQLTYGSATKRKRLELELPKSHVNDAFSMGEFHPKKRVSEEHFVKRRRNNCVLEKFYDAKVIDTRTGEAVKGVSLGCERTNRREPRNSEKSLRKFRGVKVSKGRRSIRKTHYCIQPGDLLSYDGKLLRACGVHNNGSRVIAVTTEGKKSIPINKLTVLTHVGGWTQSVT
jgi:hypothetical protein